MPEDPNKPDPTLNEATPAVAATDPPAKETSDPDGGAAPKTVAQEDYDKLQTELEGFKAMSTALGEAGITSADQLVARFKQPSADDFTKLIQDALTKSKDPPVTPPKPEAMSSEAITKLITDQFEQLQKVQEDRATSNATTQEAELKTRVLGDPAFKAIMQGATFEQACKGEKGLAAKILATHADHLFFERGLNSPDGGYHPVTSAAAVSEIVNDLRKTLIELKTVALLEGSTEPTGLEDPDAPDKVPDIIMADLSGQDLMIGDEEAEARRRKQDEAVRRTFESSYRRAQAAQLGEPLSQGV